MSGGGGGGGSEKCKQRRQNTLGPSLLPGLPLDPYLYLLVKHQCSAGQTEQTGQGVWEMVRRSDAGLREVHR